MHAYTAIIIEPRKHKALAFVLQNFLENLSEDWGFTIFHGQSNKEYILDIIHALPAYKHRFQKLVQLNVDNLNQSEYSELFKTKEFYDCIDTDIFLNFQTDALILKEHKDLLNLFLQYDYVGAPWNNTFVGNGGLSLRKKSKMLEILRTVPKTTSNEDIFFCTENKTVPMHRPPFELAKLFSVETVFSEISFGIHNIWRWLPINEIEYIVKKHKDVGRLIELNK